MNKIIKVLTNSAALIICIFSFNLLFPVKVKADNVPKIVYLTFDDGPTYKRTYEILDVLKKYGVKATFFIVGKEIDGKEDILRRIYKEGHGIGVHTYTHNERLIYKSEDYFIAENILTAEKIDEITGFYPKILRFPGGSCPRLSKSLLEKLHKYNFKVFDWNSNIEDGENPYLCENSLYINSLKIKGDKNKVIILMHCNYNNNNTIKALPKIIEKYKSEGYIFQPITDLTDEYYFRFKK